MLKLKEPIVSHSNNEKKTILVAPLHWGLGHATRCIPIIQALLDEGYEVCIGSDGAALELLKKEFPDLPSIELPSYDISYARNGGFFRLKMALKLPHIYKTMRAERKLIQQLVAAQKIDGIISDNRFGVHHNDIPSIYITHQLTVPSRSTSKISSALHQKLIAKYDECWVPDVPGPINLSGKLGHLRNTHLPIQHIGPLSRMSPLNLEIKYDILCLLSGPEPQRSMLEKKLRNELAGSDKRIAIVQGVVEGGSNCTKEAQFTVFNYLQTEALEKLINQSTMVISRPGYTTIMDLAQMQKPAFFIPTPGQSEQQYLAKKLRRQGLVPSCSQRKFNLRQLRKSTVYKGLYAFKKREDFSDLFRLFEGKGELRAYA